MSVHVHCTDCQKMYLEVPNGEKEKTHVLGLCPKCATAEIAYRERQQTFAAERKQRKEKVR